MARAQALYDEVFGLFNIKKQRNNYTKSKEFACVREALNSKYAIDNLLRAEIASKSATSLLFSISL
ncbi:hypothetical protein GCM10027284_02430 [Cyclobacterium sediminis]